MDDDFGQLQTLLAQFNEQKREGLIWLFCYLYSLQSMSEEGICTPSTPKLAICGVIERSDSTIRRYLAVLVKLNLIEREFPNRRKHLIIATPFGQKLFESRKQNPALLAAPMKVDRLNKINNIVTNNNTIDNLIENETFTSKPVFRRFDDLVLQSMLKKCTDCFEKADKIAEEIKWSIEFGSLMEKKGTDSYHSVPDAVRIAVWLVKSGRWFTPKGFGQWLMNDQICRRNQEMVSAEKLYKTCETKGCGVKGYDVKAIFTEKDGVKVFCPRCYTRNLSLEHKNVRGMLSRVIREEFLQYTGLNLDENKFKAFLSNSYMPYVDSHALLDKLIPHLEVKEGSDEGGIDDDRMFLSVAEMEGFLRAEHVVENYFRNHKKEAV